MAPPTAAAKLAGLGFGWDASAGFEGCFCEMESTGALGVLLGLSESCLDTGGGGFAAAELAAWFGAETGLPHAPFPGAGLPVGAPIDVPRPCHAGLDPGRVGC